MCSIVFVFQPNSTWPLILAGNRDEMRDRPSLPPGCHWPEWPGITAGKDLLGGGSWFGLNDDGVMAVVMNREGTLGPLGGKRSRGELVLQALQYANADKAAAEILRLPATEYRGFNLLIADSLAVHWVSHQEERGSRRLVDTPVEPGFHMLTARDLDDRSSPRIDCYYDRFKETVTPDPDAEDWREWAALLASRDYAAGSTPQAAMNVDLGDGFATVSSNLLALPDPSGNAQPQWLFADGAPDHAEFQAVTLV